MKITKTQKDAVISLLKEKFDEKQKVATEKWLKENETEVALEVDAYKGYIEALTDVCKQLNNIKKTFGEFFKNVKYINKGNIFEPSITTYWYGSKHEWKVCYDYSESDKLLKQASIDLPDFKKVERQLELDTLSKDFDLQSFIDKYLEK